MASSRRKLKLKLKAIFLLMVVIQVTMIYNTINYNYFRFKLKRYNIDIFYKKKFRLKLHFWEYQSLAHGNATVAIVPSGFTERIFSCKDISLE